jgi:hypothetical protein
MITSIRYTIEHNTPMLGLVGDYKLSPGEDTSVFPKVGQVNVRVLNEGEEMSNEQDLGLTTLNAQTNEVGGYIILTERLLNRTARSAGNLYTTVAHQFGDAKSRLMNTDILGLFTALNGGTNLGSAGIPFSAANATAAVSIAKSNKMGGNLAMVHHPNAVMRLARDLSTIGSGQTRPLPEGYSARLLGKQWSGYKIWDVPVFETGDITRDGSDDAIGAIFNSGKAGALAMLRSGVPHSYRIKAERRRAWEMGYVSEWLAFELDDTLGAGITCDAVNPTLA